MKAPKEIQCLSRENIDQKKWDQCIQNADPGHVYAESFYLDTLASNWDGLVLNDYEAVMPLPKRKKWGINYLFQPFLTPLLGVFGKSIDEGLVSNFLDTIPPSFRLWDINLHPGNLVNPRFQQQFRRKNYWLSLRSSYHDTAAKYSDNIERNISKAKKLGCRLERDIAVEEIG